MGSVRKETLIQIVRFAFLGMLIMPNVLVCQASEKKSRWSLSEWLDTRDRMKLQDMWLALHMPSLYEFDLGGSYQFVDSADGVKSNVSEVYFAAYASVFGLEGRYEAADRETRWYGLFNFRIFGYHDQSTNLTLQAGVRNSSNAFYSFNNALAGLSLTFYISQVFGLEGLYRHYFLSTPNSTGVTYAGERYQVGAFLDFRNLRIYGDYYINSETQLAGTGAAIGIRLYF